ncbi:SDH family Clp fold serine proteinase [Hyphomicrobium sulfonivorans]|uniref:SDH family Clp fold serine proteinase n=1 Tax=Hyphomicrobium sulfonivorans TaxID=121290 RepID=UPI00156F993E|nr:hypothetical protein [Hyphomicrobium sulfonivorans]MBI1650402.1 hypothetical protein [Hyphomicrobium sulfonivorans]NSL72237.1 hypothetical protein [Hyphomicrobium sulfonivorans]
MVEFMKSLPDPLAEAVKPLADRLNADVYFYNGSMAHHRDYECAEIIFSSIGHKKAVLVLVTMGGSPDVAYKIGRYFQDKYEDFSVLVPGKCKSAGTLIAIAANEVVFMPYGELGPLDIQLTKVDRFDSMQSGLVIKESLDTLEKRALDKFFEIVNEYMRANNGLLSFASATHAAAEFVTKLYGPIFGNIDPEEIGARARSMKIATDYGMRLDLKWKNLKVNALKSLSDDYPSHSFVIDHREADKLFNRVRLARKDERALVAELGKLARFEIPRVAATDYLFQMISTKRNIMLANSNEDASNNGSRSAESIAGSERSRKRKISKTGLRSLGDKKYK